MVLNIYAFRFIALLFVSVLGYLPLQAQDLEGGAIGYYQPPRESIIMSYGSGRLRISNRSDASGGVCLGSYLYQWQLSYDETEWQDLDGYVGTQFDETYSAEIPLRLAPGENWGILFFRRKAMCKNEIAYSNTLRIHLKLPGTGIQLNSSESIPFIGAANPLRKSSILYAWKSE